MRNLLVGISMCLMVGLIGMIGMAGCAQGPEEEAEHDFERTSSGAVILVDDLWLDDAPQGFERSEGGKGQEQQLAAAPTCSGRCNATTCSCTGSFECCLAGCLACWEVVQ